MEIRDLKVDDCMDYDQLYLCMDNGFGDIMTEILSRDEAVKLRDHLTKVLGE